MTFARHSWSLSSEGSLTCHALCDTDLPFIMVIFEDPWHSHLLPSVWQWSCHYLFLRQRDRTPIFRMRGKRSTSTPPHLPKSRVSDPHAPHKPLTWEDDASAAAPVSNFNGVTSLCKCSSVNEARMVFVYGCNMICTVKSYLITFFEWISIF